MLASGLDKLPAPVRHCSPWTYGKVRVGDERTALSAKARGAAGCYLRDEARVLINMVADDLWRFVVAAALHGPMMTLTLRT